MRILFHFSSFAAKTEFSRGPENISCEHQRIKVSECQLSSVEHLYISVKTCPEVTLPQHEIKHPGVVMSQTINASLTVNVFNQPT